MSGFSVKQLQAKWTLGTELLKRVLFAPLLRAQTGRTWMKQLKSESLGETPQNAWENFEPASRCIACGICDSVGRGDTALSYDVMGAAREPSVAPLVADAALELHALAKEIARICPARVDAEAIAKLIDGNARQLEE